MTKKYRVRNIVPLQREVWTRTANGHQKSIKTYQPEEQIELEDEEYSKYEHLLETEEQYQERNKQSSSKRGSK